MPRDKSHRSRRRSSSNSSLSSYERKRSKKKSKKRSRSHSRSLSRSRKNRRSYSRSVSRDRYSSRSKRSSSKSRHKKSSRRSHSYDRERSQKTSKEKRRSRSSSRDYRRTSHKRSKRRSSEKSSNSSKSQSPEKLPAVRKQYIIEEPTAKKLEKAIRAAEAAGLTMTKIQTFDIGEVEIKEDMPTIQDRNLLNEINSDSFVQKQFKSSRSKKMNDNIIINLDNNTIKLPEVGKNIKEDELLDLSAFPSEEDAREMWIRKLYLYRKKMLKGEI